MGIFDSLAGSLNDGLKTVTNEFLPAGLKNVEGKIRKVQKLAENVTSSKGFAKAGRAVHLPPGASGKPVAGLMLGAPPEPIPPLKGSPVIGSIPIAPALVVA